MSDPVDERLRSYYRSIGGDPPAGLETRVARALDSAAAKPFASQVRAPWRPAFGLVAAGVAVIVVALVVRSLAPVAIPSASASPMAGQSAWPTPTPVPTPPPTPTPGVTMPTSQPESPSPGLSPTARPAGTLEATGAMNPALSQTVAVRLADGRVLITGGREGRSNGVTLLRSQAAEIYDPNGGVFTPTGSMADPRAGHTATLLNDGRVLVVGGIDASDGFDNLATAELYDPATGQFTRTGSLAQGRAHQTATLLDDGRVLIAGGYGGGTLSLKSAEIYDPATGKFTATGSMAAARSGFGAMGLEDGRVLVAGGRDATGAILESAEIYDPGTAKFSPAGSMTAAGASTAVWLKDARVMFVSSGGMSVYDPASETFSPVGNPTASIDTATSFAVGDVLLTEGGPAQVYMP